MKATVPSEKSMKPRILLAIDVGNTSITSGICRRGRWDKKWRFPTSKPLGKFFKDVKLKTHQLDGIIISSVVPKVLPELERKLYRLFNIKPLVVGRDLDYGVPNLYKKPDQVGSDRLVNAVAARRLYGSPLIIVDFGTACTFDLISKKGEYLGGIIAPGVELSLKALSKAAALLPEVNLARPRGLLGKETKESMISGVIYGFSSLCDGIVNKLKEAFGQKIQVIATGGQARKIVTYCKTVDRVNPWLTLEGLRMIYNGKESLRKK